VRIRFIQQVSGFIDGKVWPAVGEVRDYAEREAADLIRIGIAELHEDEAAVNAALQATANAIPAAPAAPAPVEAPAPQA